MDQKVAMDEDLGTLIEKEKQSQRQVELARIKSEKRRNILDLHIKKLSWRFENREKVFGNKQGLFELVKEILCVNEPALWLKLSKLCALEKGNLVDTIQEAIGGQVLYEESRARYEHDNLTCSLDQHLILCVHR